MVPTQAIKFPRDGNPLYPLPPDYASLSADGQRLARVNACRLRDTPQEAAESWAWFCRYYLRPDADVGFDPNFYKPPIYPSPPLHYQFVRSWQQHNCSAIGAPRSSAKSTVKRSMILWMILAFPPYEINTFLAKDDFVVEEFYRIKLQLERNPRIVADFGDQRCDKGVGIWSNHEITLQNGSLLRGLSIDGKKRGPRANWVVCDDVEYDTKTGLQSDKQIGEIKETLLKVVIPMLDDGCNLLVLGTLISRKNFLYHILRTEEDERFKSVTNGGDWYKLLVPAIDDQGRNAWAAKYTPEFLAKKRRQMGDSFFATEYLNDPRSEQDSPFEIVPDRHEYTVSQPDAAFETPWQPGPTISYHAAATDARVITYQPQTKPFIEVVNSMQRALTVDVATSLSSEADYSAVMCGGLDSRNDLWVLDGWYGRVTSAQLAQRIWDLAVKWRVHLIAVEAYSTQIELYRVVKQWAAEHADGNWLPTVIPLRPPTNLSKPDKIMGLEWRFNQGRIKLPADRCRTAFIGELYRQIRDFTPDLRGLEHDDVLDTLSMLQYVFRQGAAARIAAPPPLTTEDRFVAGELFYEGTDLPLASTVDWKQLSPEDLEAAMVAIQDRHSERPLLSGIDVEPGIPLYGSLHGAIEI